MTPRDPDLYTRYGTPPLAAHADAPTRAAIAIYRAYRLDPVLERAPTAAEVRLVAMYCCDYIYGPLPVYVGEDVLELQRRVLYIRTLDDLARWLWDCRRIGIEPL
jgi:hypothetical protein